MFEIGLIYISLEGGLEAFSVLRVGFGFDKLKICKFEFGSGSKKSQILSSSSDSLEFQRHGSCSVRA